MKRKYILTGGKLKSLLILILAIVLLAGCGKEPVETGDTTGSDVVAEEGENTTESTEPDKPEGSEEENILDDELIKNIEEEGKKELEMLKEPQKGEEIAVMTTNMGVMKFRLFGDKAPKAVENFKTHAKDGYYNGIIFHRVIDGFMIQGGDPQGEGYGGESIYGKPFEDEFDLFYRNIGGALSMANAGPNTNGSQFFVVQRTKMPKDLIDQMKSLGAEGGFPDNVIKAYEELGGQPHLDYKHTVFGYCFEGQDVVDKIAKVEKDKNDKPLEPVTIEKLEIVKYE